MPRNEALYPLQFLKVLDMCEHDLNKILKIDWVIDLGLA